ncbi:MAG: hypothetical protein JWP37_2520 [Mucilaginibacter sp.]|nr:hypothetical protein [Mucilaginibacter sp.]
MMPNAKICYICYSPNYSDGYDVTTRASLTENDQCVPNKVHDEVSFL